MHRFFLFDTPLNTGQSVDITPIRQQLASVLRAQPGDEITLLDGRGYAAAATITSLSKNHAAALLHERYAVHTEPKIQLTLYQGTLKADKFEWVLQKGTELGIAHFVPIISTRSIVRPQTKVLRKYDRWRKIIQEAAEQSGRGLLPTLGQPLEFDAAISAAVGAKFMPWEEKLQAPNCALGAMIHHNMAGIAKTNAVSLLVGSEGGFEEAEVDAAQAKGWQIASLGPRILRAETAALSAVTIVFDRLGEMG